LSPLRSKFLSAFRHGTCTVYNINICGVIGHCLRASANQPSRPIPVAPSCGLPAGHVKRSLGIDQLLPFCFSNSNRANNENPVSRSSAQLRHPVLSTTGSRVPSACQCMSDRLWHRVTGARLHNHALGDRELHTANDVPLRAADHCGGGMKRQIAASRRGHVPHVIKQSPHLADNIGMIDVGDKHAREMATDANCQLSTRASSRQNPLQSTCATAPVSWVNWRSSEECS